MDDGSLCGRNVSKQPASSHLLFFSVVFVLSSVKELKTPFMVQYVCSNKYPQCVCAKSFQAAAHIISGLATGCDAVTFHTKY